MELLHNFKIYLDSVDQGMLCMCGCYAESGYCKHTSSQLALLLVVSPEERLRRIRARGGDLTVEEKMIEKDRQFQERSVAVYM